MCKFVVVSIRPSKNIRGYSTTDMHYNIYLPDASSNL
jgi:hypothetical protein